GLGWGRRADAGGLTPRADERAHEAARAARGTTAHEEAGPWLTGLRGETPISRCRAARVAGGGATGGDETAHRATATLRASAPCPAGTNAAAGPAASATTVTRRSRRPSASRKTASGA